MAASRCTVQLRLLQRSQFSATCRVRETSFVPALSPALKSSFAPAPVVRRRGWRCSTLPDDDDDKFLAPIPSRSRPGESALLKQDEGAPASDPASKFLFNREREVFKLKTIISTRNGASFIIVVGPPSTGKSIILKKLKQDSLFAQARGEDAAPVILVDCRSAEVSTPEGFASAARAQLGGLFWQLRRFLGRLTPTLPWGSVDMKQKEEGLNGFFADMTAYVMNLPPSAARPTLIVDDVNMLYAWTEPSKDGSRKQALLQFIAFCIQMSKQDGRMNVIFVSSDTFVFYWMADFGLRQDAYSIEIVENLGAEETRAYLLEYQLPRSFAPPALREEFAIRWREVFAITGGNMGAINKCVLLALASSINSAFGQILVAAEEAFERGLAPAAAMRVGKDEPKWTSEQFKTIARLLVDAPGGCVLRKELHDKLGKDGAAAVRSLVDYNLLQLRFMPVTDAQGQNHGPGAVQADRSKVFVAAEGAASLIVMREWVAATAEKKEETSSLDSRNE